MKGSNSFSKGRQKPLRPPQAGRPCRAKEMMVERRDRKYKRIRWKGRTKECIRGSGVQQLKTVDLSLCHKQRWSFRSSGVCWQNNTTIYITKKRVYGPARLTKMKIELKLTAIYNTPNTLTAILSIRSGLAHTRGELSTSHEITPKRISTCWRQLHQNVCTGPPAWPHGNLGSGCLCG